MEELFAIKRMRCPDSLSISWAEIPPYIYNTTEGKVGGIFHGILKNMVNFCCQDRTTLNYTETAAGLAEFQNLLLNGTDDIFLPVYGDGKKKKRLGEPFVSIVDSPGIAFFSGNVGSAQEAMIEAFTTSWPVLVVVLLFALAVGAAFWVAEIVNCSAEIKEDDCQDKYKLKNALLRSLEGPYQGFYWAMVTLTTVGYGDFSPKTFIGRLLAIVWILFGTVILSMFTASITSGLIAACLSNDIPLAGTKVAVMSKSKEAGIAVKKNAIAVDYSTIEDLSRVLKNGDTDGLLLDIYVAGFYQKLFENFLLADVIEYVFTYGLLLRNKGTWMDRCFRLYIDIEKDQLFEDITGSVIPFKPLNFGNQASKKSSTLIDWKSRPLQLFLAGVGSVLVFLIISGICLDKYLKKKRTTMARTNGNSNDTWNNEDKSQLQKLEQINERCGTYFHLKAELTVLGESIEEMISNAEAMQNRESENSLAADGNVYYG